MSQRHASFFEPEIRMNKNVKPSVSLTPFLPWVCVLALYGPVFYILYKERWAMIDYGHAPFILPVSLFIVWTKRGELSAIKTKTSPVSFVTGLGLLMFGASMFNFGWRMEYLLIQTLSLFPLLSGLIIFLYGTAILRSLMFPLFYLLLLVPLPLGLLDSVTLPMRHFASVTSQMILHFFHYPVTRSGLLLNLGGHEIFLGAPCSGFRSLITMLALGLIYVYFNQGKLVKNLILIAAIVPLALFGNIVRVITICLITYYFGDRAGQGFLHDFSGMVVFLIMILGLMALENRLKDK